MPQYTIAGAMYSVAFVTIYFVIICTGEVFPPRVAVVPVQTNTRSNELSQQEDLCSPRRSSPSFSPGRPPIANTLPAIQQNSLTL